VEFKNLPGHFSPKLTHTIDVQYNVPSVSSISRILRNKIGTLTHLNGQSAQFSNSSKLSHGSTAVSGHQAAVQHNQVFGSRHFGQNVFPNKFLSLICIKILYKKLKKNCI
jgi:hypothetical protein